LREATLVTAVWGVSLVLVYNLCNLVFTCGCTYVWAGAADGCNVHHASGPHCPWCSHGRDGFFWVLLPIVGAETLALVLLRRRPMAVRVLAAGAAYLLAGAAAGLAIALVDRYPRFLGIPLP
jgi:hypothetical protein